MVFSPRSSNQQNNQSLTLYHGNFPMALKHSLVTPLQNNKNVLLGTGFLFNEFLLGEATLLWFQPYLSCRPFPSRCSQNLALSCGVPRGSGLALVLETDLVQL